MRTTVYIFFYVVCCLDIFKLLTTLININVSRPITFVLFYKINVHFQDVFIYVYCIDMLHPVYISINSVGMLYTYIPVHVHVYIQVYCIEIHCMYIVCIYISLFGVFITLYWCNILIFFFKNSFFFS